MTQTSASLIDAALGAGTLTPNQALVYHVVAELGPAGLPAEHQGLPNQDFDGNAELALMSHAAGLSADEQAVLFPFPCPPSMRAAA
jgi:hypothetical protein